MTLIQPTDIMLGRGPTCYNSPGNKVFRKLVKEHAVFYTNKTRRKVKAALVNMLVSKIEAKGYRFLHRSTDGTWIEAPLHLVEKKVGHGLRDARLTASKIGGCDVNVLPRNSRPDTTEQTHKRQVKSVIIEQEKSNEGKLGEVSYNTAMITTGEDLKCDACHSLSDFHLMQGGAIPEKGQHLLDAKAPSNASESFASTTVPHEFLLADGALEDAELPLFDNKVDECSNQWGSGGHVSNSAELRSHELPSSSEVGRGLEYRDGSWDDKNDATVLPDVLPSHGATHTANVDVALTMYAAFYKDLLSFEDLFACDPYEPLKKDVEDAQSLCRWFSHLL